MSSSHQTRHDGAPKAVRRAIRRAASWTGARESGDVGRQDEQDGQDCVHKQEQCWAHVASDVGKFGLDEDGGQVVIFGVELRKAGW